MLVKDYISKDFAPAKISQTAGHALKLVDKFNLTHIPVLEDLEFAGNLSKEILEENEASTVLSKLKDFFENFFIDEKASLLDAVQIYHNHTSNVLPILNQTHHYVGMLMLDDVISGLSSMPLIIEPGSIMIVEIPQKKLSFSEISNIVESNNAKIIGMFVTAYQDENVRVALKLVSENLTSVGETFERFDYKVVYKFFNDEKEELMKERFEQLMKYLNI